MVIGILFCCSLAMGINGLSVVLGVLMLIIGILYIINSITQDRNTISKNCLIGIIISSTGIIFIINKLAGIIFSFIPWFLIVLGTTLIADSVFEKFHTKNDSKLIFIVKIIAGALSIVLGLCLNLIDEFLEYSALIIGIMLILYSAYLLFKTFLQKSE
jgi:uncharacterized membrane protein HdeD (DUF308 family)